MVVLTKGEFEFAKYVAGLRFIGKCWLSLGCRSCGAEVREFYK